MMTSNVTSPALVLVAPLHGLAGLLELLVLGEESEDDPMLEAVEEHVGEPVGADVTYDDPYRVSPTLGRPMSAATSHPPGVLAGQARVDRLARFISLL